MGSAERQNGQPDPGNTPKEHPLLKGLGRETKKAARWGGRAAYRGATYVPRQTARAGKDFLIGKRRKHAGRVLAAGAVATVALGVGAYRTAENVIEDIHMPDTSGVVDEPANWIVDRAESAVNLGVDLTWDALPMDDTYIDLGGSVDQDGSEIEPPKDLIPEPPEPSALNPEQEAHIGALVAPFLNALPAGEQPPTIKYTPKNEGKSGYHIDTKDHEIDISVNGADMHDDLQTAQVLAHVAALEYLDTKLDGALNKANEAAEDGLTDMNDQIAVGSNRGDQLSPAKKQFLNEKLDWDSADEFIKIITTARLLPENLIAYMSQAEENGYGTDVDAVKAILKTRLKALTPLTPAGQPFPEYLASIGFDPRIIEIASAA